MAGEELGELEREAWADGSRDTRLLLRMEGILPSWWSVSSYRSSHPTRPDTALYRSVLKSI